MKPVTTCLPIAAALVLASLPAQSQNSAPPTGALAASPADVSLSALVQMSTDQIERLNRLASTYYSRRAGQEAQLARLQTQLAAAQSPTAFDEKKVARLLREVGEARQKATGEFLSARAKALQALQSVQRAQLASIATDKRFQIRRDAYFELLLLPVEQLDFASFSAPRQGQPFPASRDDLRSRGNGNVGVYGGLGRGGPNYGVYGGYSQGGIGVYGGLGRGGPSIGIGIGGLFGGRGRRW